MKVDITHPNRQTIKVFLNGEEQKYVTQADDESGYVDKYAWPLVVGPDGNLILHRLFGKVVIEGV